jgi:hypothetical protein
MGSLLPGTTVQVSRGEPSSQSTVAVSGKKLAWIHSSSTTPETVRLTVLSGPQSRNGAGVDVAKGGGGEGVGLNVGSAVGVLTGDGVGVAEAVGLAVGVVVGVPCAPGEDGEGVALEQPRSPCFWGP